MEIGFIIIMLCLVMTASTFIYLVYTHCNRSCKSCKFFRPTANSKGGYDPQLTEKQEARNYHEANWQQILAQEAINKQLKQEAI